MFMEDDDLCTLFQAVLSQFLAFSLYTSIHKKTTFPLWQPSWWKMSLISTCRIIHHPMHLDSRLCLHLRLPPWLLVTQRLSNRNQQLLRTQLRLPTRFLLPLKWRLAFRHISVGESCLVSIVFLWCLPRFAYSLVSNPKGLQCPYCHRQSVTRVRDRTDSVTILLVVLLLLLFWPLFWLPFCIPGCKSTDHYCSLCNRKIGTTDACEWWKKEYKRYQAYVVTI